MAEKNKAKICLKRVIDFIKAPFVLFVRCGSFLIHSIENFSQVILVLLILLPTTLLLIIHPAIFLNTENIFEALTAIGTITVAIIAIRALNFTGEQLQHSRTVNKNERAAKAIEMLESQSEASYRMALYIFKDLIWEEKDKIKCMEYGDMLADSIRKNQGSPDLRKMAVYMLGDMPEAIRKEYRYKNGLSFWPNLCGANLEGVQLPKVCLQGADLQKTMLQETNLNYANLEEANLKKAILIEAEFICANLRGVNFWEANLNEARLGWADLQGAGLQIANLQGASLRSANLQEAQMHDANLKDADLHGADMKDANLIFTLVSGAKMEHVKGLTKEWIVRATWKDAYELGKPPELPKSLLEDPDVQKWLKDPGKLYQVT